MRQAVKRPSKRARTRCRDNAYNRSTATTALVPCGGTERAVSWLTEELVDLGRDVTLFASGNPPTSTSLEAIWPRSVCCGRVCGDVEPLASAPVPDRPTANARLRHRSPWRGRPRHRASAPSRALRRRSWCTAAATPAPPRRTSRTGGFR